MRLNSSLRKGGRQISGQRETSRLSPSFLPEHVHLLLSDLERANLAVVLQMLKQVVPRKLTEHATILCPLGIVIPTGVEGPAVSCRMPRS